MDYFTNRIPWNDKCHKYLRAQLFVICLWSWFWNSISNFFSRLGLFPQVFGQVKEWLILELHEIIKNSHILTCSIVSILLRHLVRHGVVFEHIKMVSFKYFSLLWSVPLRFWAGLGADHTVFWKNRVGMFYNCMLNSFYCALKWRSAGRSAQTYGECSN